MMKSVFILLTLLASATNGNAQRFPGARDYSSMDRMASFDSLSPADSLGEGSSLATVIAASAGLGAVGYLVGGVAAIPFAVACTGHEFCEFTVLFNGIAIGGTLGMAFGAHLGNKRKGSLALDVLSAAAVGLGGLGVVVAASSEDAVAWPVVVAVPIAQIGATVAVERVIGQRRSRTR